MTGEPKRPRKNRNRDWAQRAASVMRSSTSRKPSNSGRVPNYYLDGANDDASSQGSGPSSHITKVDKMSRPNSKTAIGRLTCVPENLPTLLVIDTVIESRADPSIEKDDWKPVEGHKLRRLAIEKWLSDPKLKPYQSLISYELRSNDTARVIVKPRDTAHLIEIRAKIESIPAMIDLERTTKTEDGALLQETIRCTGKPNRSDKALGESVEHLIRRSAYTLKSFEDLSGEEERIDVLPPGQSNHEVTKGKFKLYIRTQPSMDVHRNLLHLDLDVVPCVPVTSIEDILTSLLGRQTIPDHNSPPDEQLTVKDIEVMGNALKGLHVRCSYIPGKRLGETRVKAEMLEGDDIRKRGRMFQIKDIKIPAAVDGFEMGKQKKSFTVYEYFKDVVLPEDNNLNTALPLVKDDSGAWIPLGLLHFDSVQPLGKIKVWDQDARDHKEPVQEHKEFIRGRIRSFLRKCNDKTLPTLAGDILRDTTNTGSLFTWSSIDFAPARHMPDVKAVSESSSRARVAVVAIKGTNANTESDFIEKIHFGLEHHQLDIVASTEISYDAVLNASFVLDNHDGRADLILAIVNDTGRGKSSVQEIISRLHHKAEIEMGTRLVCTKLSHLMVCHDKSSDTMNYIPSNLLAKLKIVLGQTNYGHATLQKLVEGYRIMIAGAHLAHPSSGTQHCPSIAAVVASKDTSATHFPGTARIQGTTIDPSTGVAASTKHAMPKPKRLKAHIEATIIELTSMMQELFDEWKVVEKDPPLKLFFFRDSIDFNHKGIETEIKQIKFAYKTVFPKSEPLKLTYVVINKNTPLEYVKTTERDDTKVTPKFDYLADGDDIKTHRFYVVHNDTSRTTTDMAEFTAALNESSQLSQNYEQTAKALPVLWAKKLTDCMHDYFRLAVPLPPIEKKVDLETRLEAEKAAVKKVNDYLGIDPGDAGSRQRPWKEELDGTMFFL